MPEYPDSSRIWHYHVVCKGCQPDWLTAPTITTEAVPTRAEAFRLQAEYNASIHGIGAQHRHVLMGCAGPTCTVNPLSPD